MPQRSATPKRRKLAIVATHPIQYYSPWFRYIAAHTDLALRVFYLWDFGVQARRDPGFDRVVQWDVPLLEGYEAEFVPNTSSRPGTHRFFGLRNPSLASRLARYEPDAVLMLGYNFASLLRLILTWRPPRAPLLFRGDSHRLYRRGGLAERLRRALIARIFRRFAAVLYVGRANYDYFRYHGVGEEKLFRAPHAVDNDRYTASAAAAERDALAWKHDLGIPQTDLVVLFAGKLEADKDPLTLLRAYAALERTDVSLLLVGSGSLAAAVEREAGAHPKIFLAGFQNQSLMPRSYCAADLVVLPSTSETWGLAVNEAMCMSRAVLVSDRVGCAADLIVPGENGLVFRAGDVSALASALREALADRVRLRAWGRRSRELIEGFHYRHATAGLVQALRRLNVPAGES